MKKILFTILMSMSFSAMAQMQLKTEEQFQADLEKWRVERNLKDQRHVINGLEREVGWRCDPKHTFYEPFRCKQAKERLHKEINELNLREAEANK